jgi:ABC-type nitrate/sulfonate/bicarbonate transport system permease component
VITLNAVVRPLFNLVFVLVCLVLAWQLLLSAGGVNELVARTPDQVLSWLFSDDKAGENRAAVLHPLGQTVLDAGIGFVAGLAAATAIAVGTYLSRGVETATMPVALIVRTVPLVALSPIITLLFGNGFWTVAVMSGVVVLFPALVTISFGLRSVSQQMKDVVGVYGGSEVDVIRRVAFPTALPSFFAAIRISVPGAVTGALIAEFYTSPDSVGKAVNQALALYQYDLVWSLLVVVTLTSVVLYVIAQLLERIVLARFGQAERA